MCRPIAKDKSGNAYLLTVMCASTRFPEAITLRKINSQNIVKALTRFFTMFGLPSSVQSDRGSSFLSGLFQQVMKELGITQVVSSAYHPQSQGAFERYHQTMQTMLRCYCLKYQKDWDEGIPLVMFASRSVVQESLGFSPFELVFWHNVRGPMTVLSEQWLSEVCYANPHGILPHNPTDCNGTWNMAEAHLKKSQSKMKHWYDRKAKTRSFKSGDKVLV